MAELEQLQQLLLRLAEDSESQEQQPDGSCCALTVDDLDTVRACAVVLQAPDAATEFWQAIGRSGEVSFVNVARTLGQSLRQAEASADTLLLAATVYSGLLALNGSPASSLFDTFAFTGFLQALKKGCTSGAGAAAGSKGAGGKGGKAGGKRKASAKAKAAGSDDDMIDEEEAEDDGDDMDAEQGPTQRATQRGAGTQGSTSAGNPLALCIECLQSVESFIRGFPLKDAAEMLALILDTCVDIVSTAPSTSASGATGRAKARARGTEGPATVPEAAYLVLCALLDTRHGDVTLTASSAIHRLLPVVMGATSAGAGAQGSKRAAGQDNSARRAASVQFVLSVYRRYPAESRQAVSALVRALLLRAPDRADARAAAIASVQELVAALPGQEQLLVAGFLSQVSRSARPAHRLAAVEAAHALLAHLPAPFDPAAGYKAFMDGSHGPGEDVVAPWSATCLAVLAQRCDDKSAAVRSRALAHLTDAVEAYSKLVAAGGGAERGPAAAGAGASAGGMQLGGTGASPLTPVGHAFLLALCGSGSLKVQVTRVAIPAPSAGGGAAGGAAAQGRAPPKAAGGRAKAGAKGSKAGGKRGQRGGRRGAAIEDSDSEVEVDAVEEMSEGEEGRDRAQQGGGAPPQGGIIEVEEQVAVLPSRIRLDLGPLMALAHRRARDDKAPARKAALGLLEAALLLRAELPAPAGGPPTAADTAAIAAATTDSLVSVRRAALGAAGRLVSVFPHDPQCCDLWVRCSLALIRDPEPGVQDAVLDQVQSLVLARATAAAKQGPGAKSATSELRPLLAAIMVGGRATGAALGKALSLLAQRKQMAGKQVAAGLEALLKQQQQEQEAEQALTAREAQGAWNVLREVAAVDPSAPSWQFLQARWQEVQGRGRSAGGEEGAALLWVISHAASRFPAADAAALAKALLKALLAFTLPPAAAAAHVAALHRLSSSSDDSSGKDQSDKQHWAAKVLEGAREVLAKLVEGKGSKAPLTAVAAAAAAAPAQQWKAAVALFTAGEIGVLKVTKPPSALALLVQALTATPSPAQRPTGGNQGTQAEGGAGGVPTPATQAPGEGQVDLAAYAWVALGKLCMADEGLAKRTAPLFVQEALRSPSPVSRNNCLVAVCDMAIHFTALVDSHLPRLAALIRDPHELIRKQALALLANLLMRDYVKWRGSLFHRFCLALVDPAPVVKALAEHLLGDTLAAKAPMLAYNHFVESLHVLNGCKAGLHAARLAAHGGGGSAEAGPSTQATQADTLADESSDLFTLKGATPEMRAKRDVVYHTLLRRMAPEHKFATQAKLVSEVLGGVADGLLPLEAEGVEEVLGDALRLLGSKEIKVNASRMAATDEDALLMAGPGAPGGAGQATQAAEQVARAKGKLVSAMMKKHLVESVVPLLVELKHMLTELRHPLLGQLMLCMASLLRDYKSELEDILVADKQLAREILHDMKQAELAAKQQQTQQQQGATTAAAAVIAGAAAAAGPARPPGTTAKTPLAAEVLAAAAARGIGTAARPATRPGQTPAAAAAAGAATPGAGLLRSAGSGGAVSPAAGLLAAARTPGAGILPTPHRSALGRALTPAPLSQKFRQQAQGRGAVPSTSSGAGAADGLEDAPVLHHVLLPPVPAEDGEGGNNEGEEQQQQRVWNIQLKGPAAKQGQKQQQGEGSKATRGRATRQGGAGAEVSQAGETQQPGDEPAAGEDDTGAAGAGKGAGRKAAAAAGGSRSRGRAAAALNTLDSQQPGDQDVGSGKGAKTGSKVLRSRKAAGSAKSAEEPAASQQEAAPAAAKSRKRATRA